MSANRTRVGLVLVAMFTMVMFGNSASAATNPTLGDAGSFGVLAGSTVTNTGPSLVFGDVGVAPGSAVTGFPPGAIAPPGAIHGGDSTADEAQSAVALAFTNLALQPCDNDLTGQDLGGLTLTPGVYCFSSSAFLTGVLTLNTLGNPEAVFVFQTGSTLITASNSSVVFTDGEATCNIFWKVGSSATIGTETTFEGNILALASITANTGANIEGRLLASTGAVTLDTNTITGPYCVTPVSTDDDGGDTDGDTGGDDGDTGGDDGDEGDDGGETGGTGGDDESNDGTLVTTTTGGDDTGTGGGGNLSTTGTVGTPDTSGGTPPTEGSSTTNSPARTITTTQYLAVTGMNVLPRALTGGGMILLGAGLLLEERRRRGASLTV